MLIAITETNTYSYYRFKYYSEKIDVCVYFLHVLVKLKSLITFILTQFTDALFLQLLKDFFSIELHPVGFVPVTSCLAFQ